MKRIMILMFAMFLLVTTFVYAEITTFNSVVIDESEQTATYIGNYNLQDTSLKDIGKSKAVELALWYSVQQLPYSMGSYGGEVDWCNFTIIQYRNIYDSLGNIINETTEETSLFFQNSNFSYGTMTFYLRTNDFIQARMKCHYTNVSALQMGTRGYTSLDEAVIGRFDTLLPAFECDKCEGHSLEDLTNEFDQIDNRTLNELEVYDWVQTLVTYNFSFWLYASWIMKILLIGVAIGLIFATVYWIYDFFTKLARKI